MEPRPQADQQARLKAIGRELSQFRSEVAHQTLQQEAERDRLSERLQQLGQWQQRLREQVPALALRQQPSAPPEAPGLTVLQGPETMQRHERELADWLADAIQDPGHSPPMPELIRRFPLLKVVVRERLLLRVVAEMSADPTQHAELVAEVWEGLPGPPPRLFDAATVAQLPAALRPELENRWAELCVRRWCERNYSPLVPRLFASRKPLLEAVIFRQIALDDLATAQELALELEDDQADFAVLARLHSRADGAAAGGLTGPVPLGELDPALRLVLQDMAPGVMQGPLQLDEHYVLLRLEARLPAQLNTDLHALLLETMLEEDLEAVLNGERPPHAWRLGPMDPSRPPAEPEPDAVLIP